MFGPNEKPLAAHQTLLERGAVADVVLGGADERLWLDCDLASLAENRLSDKTDPHFLDEARRIYWRTLATDEKEWPIASRSEYERCFWLLHEGERVGTLALALSTQGHTRLRLSSFYVFPTHRGRGIGRQMLRQLRKALAEHELGVRLETNWCWQRTVRFYLLAGLWVYMWKRDLTLFGDETPAPEIQVGETEASLAVTVGGDVITLAKARRKGDILEWEYPSEELSTDKRLGDAYWHASSTLALGIALHGWPLVRSKEEWDKSHYAHGGPPESLAYKITIWEAWAKSRRWLVETPRIAGLAYPTWDEFEARWEAENAEFEAKLDTAK